MRPLKKHTYLFGTTRGLVLRTLVAALCLVLVIGLVDVPIGHAQAGVATTGERTVTLSEDEAALFELLTSVKRWIEELSPRSVPLDVLYQGAMAGMLDAVGDPYTEFLTKEQYAAFESSIDGTYVGIGVVIDLIDGNVTVVSTFSGSPADRAGIKAGDVIVSVDGKDLAGGTTLDAQAMLRGEAGTEVSVVTRRPSDGSQREVTLVRAVINQAPLEVKDLGDGILYVKIPQFTEQAAREFSVILGVYRDSGFRGVILDVRDNPGGLLDACVDITAELVPPGPVVELRRKELSETLFATKEHKVLPTVVLVNKGSASASEILAGAVRDRGVGILVGGNTFGKASVQMTLDLQDHGGIRLTVADYFTPSGFSLAGSGLTPDIAVEVKTAPAPAPLQYKRPMTLGMVGLDVLALQESLAYLGYDAGEPDGIFGRKTLAAASRFLEDSGATWKGSFGEDDASRLRAAIVQHVLTPSDEVLETGLAALRARLESGQWPLAVPPKI